MERAHQPVQGSRVAFKLAICVNVFDMETEWDKIPCHQNRAMAFQWFLFSAHQGNPKSGVWRPNTLRDIGGDVQIEHLP